MVRRLALLTMLGAVCACDAPQQIKAPVQVVVPKEVPAAARTTAEVFELSSRCGLKSREGFQRDRAEDASKTAHFRYHYNEKLDACFYLLTVGSEEDRLSRKLIDINEGEVYGEFLGAARSPDACRVAGLYCGSHREWEVLVGFFMQD